MVMELNKKSFKKEVLESNIPVIVDFWANWCVSPDSHIYSSPLTSTIASEMRENKKILSFKDALVIDTVKYSKKTNRSGHCKRVITSTGRSLDTTDDHAFFTRRGWIAASELTKNDKVAILPVVEPINFEGKSEMLLNKAHFQFFEKDYPNLENYLTELTEKGYLPLRKDNPKLLVLARLIGSLFTDGNLYNYKKNHYREISFTLGQKKDVQSIVNDLTDIDFNKIHISERRNKCKINGRKFSLHTFRVKCTSTAFYLLFRALGVPEGNKTNQVYSLPLWIKNGEKAIKKEFLSGYLGGDGPRISVRTRPRKNKNPYNAICINDIEFRKRTDLVNSGLKLAKEIVSLLKEFNIGISKIFQEVDPYIRKDKSMSTVIHISIKNNFKNGFIISQNIGYAYCWQKQLISMCSGEFIRTIFRKRDAWSKLHKKVMDLAEKDYTNQEIAKLLNIDFLLAYQWVYMKNIPRIQKHFLKFDAWLKDSTRGLQDGIIWEPIEEVANIFLHEVQVITTENNHNFIANGFLVHNCGPCTMMAPVFEKASKNYQGRLKFAKVSTENEPDLAEQYQIRSIPCLKIFSKGEEIAEFIGFQSEASLKRQIDEVLNRL